MKRVSLWASAVAFLFIAACEKDHETSLDPGDAALFGHIPAGEVVLWGGNYAKLQGTIESIMSGMTPLVEQMGSGARGFMKWGECFTKLSEMPKARFVGGVRVVDHVAQLYFAQTGITVDSIAKCGTDAGMATHMDTDHKFVAVDMPAMMTQPAFTLGYLVLPDGSLYARENLAFSPKPTVTAAGRAELEADIAGLGGKSAAGDPLLASLGGKVDRAKTMWFVASGAGTSIADKLGELYGTFDMTSGMAVDLSVQLLKKDDADKAERGIATVKAMADQVPVDFKEVIKSIQLDRNGDHLRMRAAVSSEQLKRLVSQLGSMIPGAGMQ